MEEDILPDLPSLNPNRYMKTYSKIKKKNFKTYTAPKKVIKVQPQVLNDQPLTTKNAVEFLLEGTLKRKICRYCLNVKATLSELDQVLQVAGKGSLYKVTIRDMIASFHPFKVVEDPNIPNKICNTCLDRAIGSYLFTQQCERSERALRNCFEDVLDKLEKLDSIEGPKKRGRQKLHPNYNTLYTEHKYVIDYAEPLINIIHTASESLSNEDSLKEFECLKCCQVLPNVESLLNHEKSHPKSMWYHCRLCGTSFPKRYQLKRHMSIHNKHKFDEKNEMHFKCNKCGDVSKDHKEFLQHMEKHKFKTIMEHLVEKKMDRLCSICLDKGSHMTKLDKTVCLHGGYPELSGNRNLYNIVGSTLTEPKSYKYQELMVASHVNRLRIVKKRKFDPSTSVQDTSQYVMSLPDIISKDCASCDDFLFSRPQPITYLVEPNVDNDDVNNDDVNDCLETSDEGVADLEPKAMVKRISSICDNEENVIVMKYNKLLVDSGMISKSISEIKDGSLVSSLNDNIEINEITERNITNVTVKSATVKKTDDTDFTNDSDIVSVNKSKLEDKMNEIIEIDTEKKEVIPKSKPCNVCWVFSRLSKCEICKRVNMPHETALISYSKNACEDRSEINESNSIKTSLLVANTWKCDICLTINNTDSQTCCCCEFKTKLYDPVKVNLKQNTEFFENIQPMNNKTAKIDAKIDVHFNLKLEDPININLKKKTQFLENIEAVNINKTEVNENIDLHFNSKQNDPTKVMLKPNTEAIENTESVNHNVPEIDTKIDVSFNKEVMNLDSQFIMPNIINNAINSYNISQVQVESEATKMEIEVISENICKEATSFRLPNTIPNFQSITPSNDFMETDEVNADTHSFNSFNYTMNTTKPFNVHQPIQFKIGVAPKTKRTRNKFIRLTR